jgi:hypothetical protein
MGLPHKYGCFCHSCRLIDARMDASLSTGRARELADVMAVMLRYLEQVDREKNGMPSWVQTACEKAWDILRMDERKGRVKP